jgi:hypothetical protein
MPEEHVWLPRQSAQLAPPVPQAAFWLPSAWQAPFRSQQPAHDDAQDEASPLELADVASWPVLPASSADASPVSPPAVPLELPEPPLLEPPLPEPPLPEPPPLDPPLPEPPPLDAEKGSLGVGDAPLQAIAKNAATTQESTAFMEPESSTWRRRQQRRNRSVFEVRPLCAKTCAERRSRSVLHPTPVRFRLRYTHGSTGGQIGQGGVYVVHQRAALR